ncbi:class I SAM-dependent methyltransferase, partial [Xanthovirga aplysinae]|uniref:class I SAM-dependent methyltransferase n=1 Tax=Xanthovirga aplysinae TaxID=2529853 RepID=UPI0012BD09CE
MQENLTQCPICNSTKFNEFLSCKDFTVSGEIFQIVKCGQCNFLFTNPRPDQNSIGKYYQSEDYISHANKSNSLINTVYRFARQFTLRQKLKLIENFSVEKGHLLDIGCGTGSFLNTCKANDWKIQGIEPDPNARAQAEKLNDQRFLASIEELSDKPQYDCITLWHVLEHLPDLKFTLEKLK